MKIAEYYATRGKLTNLDVEYPGDVALTYTSQEGHLDILEALLAAGANKTRLWQHVLDLCRSAWPCGELEISSLIWSRQG